MSDFIFENDAQKSHRPTLIVAILAVLLFIAWASLSQIDQQVRGYGRIIPAGEKKIIQHLEGGIVEDILVKEGQRVEKGQALFTVNNQIAESERDETHVRIIASQLKLKRLEASYADKSDVGFIDNDFKNYADIVQNQRLQFQNDRRSFQETLNILQEQKHQKTLRLDDLRTQLRNLREERKTADRQFSINKQLKSSGAISESKYLYSQSNVQEFNTRIAQIEKQIPVIKAELSESQNRIREEKEKRKSRLTEEIGKTNLEIRQLEERIKSSDDRVLRRAVLAPETGLINKIHIKTRGGVVKPGAPLADLVPLDAALVVEAEIATKDRGQIWPNLPVNVKITAYDYTSFGSIKGTLRSISADSFKNDRGQEFYQIKVDLNTDSIGSDNPIYPGMTTEINILTGKRTILDYILKPIRHTSTNALTEK